MKVSILFFIAIQMLVFFFSCKRDPCENLICVNNGICVNGECDCPDGYTGLICADQETPSRITIHSVTVKRFPALDNGSNWDAEDGPDIYFEIFDGNTPIYDSPIYFKNANSTHDYLFSPVSIDLTDVTGNHTIRLQDYDEGSSNDEFMGGIIFTPYWNNTNGFPETIELDAGGTVAFDLVVSYSW